MSLDPTIDAPPTSTSCDDGPEEGSVVVLTGPPGAGKTTVARLVTEQLSPSVHLHADDFWHFIRQGWIAPYLPEADRQNYVVMTVLAGAAFRYASGGYQVIMDGIVGPWFVDPFRSEARTHGIALHYVVLRPDETTTLRRASGRGTDALTDSRPVRDLHRQFSDLGTLEHHALDSTALTPAETARLVLRAISEGRHLLAEG